MKERIRIDPIGRLEDRADFPRAGELRQQIIEARESGDVDRLRELQRQHRDARIAGQVQRVADIGTRVPVTTVATAPSVVRTATSVESTMDSDRTREVIGYLLTFGEVRTQTTDGESIYLTVEPADVRDWLRECDPAQVELRAEHLTKPVGCWRMFAIDDVGLRAVGLVDDSPAGREALAASYDGRAGGLSAALAIDRCVETGRRSGLRCFAGPVAIIEGSLVTRPADERCEVLRAGGRRPLAISRREALEDDAALRRTWGM